MMYIYLPLRTVEVFIALSVHLAVETMQMERCRKTSDRERSSKHGIYFHFFFCYKWL